MATKKKTSRLRGIFESPETVLMPCGTMPIHAQMAERAGYDSFHISRGMTSWWYGLPDVGLVTRTEVVDAAPRIAHAVDIPVYCDADTGYNGIQNVRRTVQECYAAGIAGIHIEDQREPKKAGGQAGMELVSDEEAVGRLRAAAATRDELDPEFIITARTDGYATADGGLEEALRRGVLYREETGVDVIFYEGIRSWDERRYLLAETPGPAYGIASRHAGRTRSVAEPTEMGQSINIMPFIIPAVAGTWKHLLKVKRAGGLGPIDEYRERIVAPQGSDEYVGHGDAFVRPTYQEVTKMEERYLPTDQQRNYENSTHD